MSKLTKKNIIKVIRCFILLYALIHLYLFESTSFSIEITRFLALYFLTTGILSFFKNRVKGRTLTLFFHIVMSLTTLSAWIFYDSKIFFYYILTILFLIIFVYKIKRLEKLDKEFKDALFLILCKPVKKKKDYQPFGPTDEPVIGNIYYLFRIKNSCIMGGSVEKSNNGNTHYLYCLVDDGKMVRLIKAVFDKPFLEDVKYLEYTEKGTLIPSNEEKFKLDPERKIPKPWEIQDPEYYRLFKRKYD